jgi:hypothetical protein
MPIGMTIEDGLWYVAFLGFCVAFYFFIRRGRQRGYEALAARTQALQPRAEIVYLLASSVGPTQASNLPLSSVWPFLNTGYLAYVTDGALVVEAPWWSKMQPVATWDPAHTTIRSEPYTESIPGLYIGNRAYHRTYIVVGYNVTDVDTVRQALRVNDRDSIEYERYGDRLRDELAAAGFSKAA